MKARVRPAVCRGLEKVIRRPPRARKGLNRVKNNDKLRRGMFE